MKWMTIFSAQDLSRMEDVIDALTLLSYQFENMDDPADMRSCLNGMLKHINDQANELRERVEKDRLEWEAKKRARIADLEAKGEEE